MTQYCEDCEIPMKVEQFEEKVSDYKKLLDLSSNDFWKSL
jgi:hypothetical protein